MVDDENNYIEGKFCRGGESWHEKDVAKGGSPGGMGSSIFWIVLIFHQLGYMLYSLWLV